MTDEFNKALTEFNTEGDVMYKEGINEGAWWAYEWFSEKKLNPIESDFRQRVQPCGVPKGAASKGP